MTVTIAEGALLLANVVEGIARASAAAQMLSADIAQAQLAGLPDIPESAVAEARKYAVARGAELDKQLAADTGG